MGMTQEDKDLLLVDLCARLPYGVMINYESHIYILNEIDPSCKDIDYITIRIQDVERLMCAESVMLESIKPYLRPMSSMTEEEVKEFYDVECMDAKVGYIKPTSNWHFTINGIDWLNTHHFDFRNLIERGLAIDCTGLNVY